MMQWSRYDIFLEIISNSHIDAICLRGKPNRLIYVDLDGSRLTTDLEIDSAVNLSYKMKLYTGKHILDIKADGWFDLISLKLLMKKDRDIFQNIPLDGSVKKDIFSMTQTKAKDHITVVFTTWE